MLETCPVCGSDELWQQRRGMSLQRISNWGCTECRWSHD